MEKIYKVMPNFFYSKSKHNKVYFMEVMYYVWVLEFLLKKYIIKFFVENSSKTKKDLFNNIFIERSLGNLINFFYSIITKAEKKKISLKLNRINKLRNELIHPRNKLTINYLGENIFTKKSLNVLVGDVGFVTKFLLEYILGKDVLNSASNEKCYEDEISGNKLNSKKQIKKVWDQLYFS